MDSSKPAHYCPDWDYEWIEPGDPEAECCTCDFRQPPKIIDGNTSLLPKGEAKHLA